MITHFRRRHGPGIPLCWGVDAKNEAMMTHPNIAEVNCIECKELYYSMGKDLQVERASFDLWLDGVDMDETAGWWQPVNLDFDRFLSDNHYANLVSEHISRSLACLAKEVEEIGIHTRRDVEAKDVD